MTRITGSAKHTKTSFVLPYFHNILKISHFSQMASVIPAELFLDPNLDHLRIVEKLITKFCHILFFFQPCEICRVGRKKGCDKKFVSPYISSEVSRYQNLPNPDYLRAKSEVETYMDPGITDDTFDDWLDLDGEENFPLQAKAAAFPEPGPSASQARKMDNKSNSNDIGLCRMCLGSFKRGTHKKKDCKKHHRYSNLLAR